MLYLSNKNGCKGIYVRCEGDIPIHKGISNHKNDVKITNEVYASSYKLSIPILWYVVGKVALNIKKLQIEG